MCKSHEACDLTLQDLGYSRYTIPTTKPETTVRDFSRTHVNGRYVLATLDHMVAVIDGYYIDTWDSGDEVPLYFYKKGR